MAEQVLVVEDESAWRMILGEILMDLGFVVDYATSYHEALRALQTRRYSLVVVDVSLTDSDHGNRDGLRLLTTVRRSAGTPPTILVSAHNSPDIRAAADQAPVVAFVYKGDFDRWSFVELVNRAGIVRTRGAVTGKMAAGNEEATAVPLASAPMAEAASGVGDRVLVVEDDRSWISIYRELLSEEGYDVQVAVSYGEALGWLRRERFALAIVDLKLINSASPLDNRDGFRLLRYTHQKGVPTLVVSALGVPEEIDQAYQEYNIFAFFDKEGFDRGEFLRTVRAALKSKPSTRVEDHSVGWRTSPDPLASLTKREREVLMLLAAGLTNREIADRLYTSPNTVKKQVGSIFSKLGVHTRAAAARLAVEYGLTD